MTVLDHSSPDALVADLYKHKGEECCFVESSSGQPTCPWKLESAAVVPVGPAPRFIKNYGVQIQYRYDIGGNTLLDFSFRLEAGWLETPNGAEVVALCDPPSCTSGTAVSQVDRNLRGAFS